MSNLFVIAYDDLATADQVRDKLLSMNREHLVELEDVVVVERREKDGKIKLHQAVNHVGTGAAGGALWGASSGCSSSCRSSVPRWAQRPAPPEGPSSTPASTTTS